MSDFMHGLPAQTAQPGKLTDRRAGAPGFATRTQVQ